MKKIIFLLSLILSLFVFNAPIIWAVDFYVGNVFLKSYPSQSNQEVICIISRFRTNDKSFTLQQADKVYDAFIKEILAPEIGYYLDMQIVGSKKPSEAFASGITGEAIWDNFVKNGTQVCTIDGKPVDKVIFFSFYNCDYQGAQHVCMRTYFHSGKDNLTNMGIPYNVVAGLGAVAYVKSFFDQLMDYLYRSTR